MSNVPFKTRPQPPRAGLLSSLALLALLGLSPAAGCGASPGQPVASPDQPVAILSRPAAARPTRMRYNQLALRLDLPLFWAEDADADGEPDPAEIRELLFYSSRIPWVRGEEFTEAFGAADAAILRAAAEDVPSDPRQALVREELMRAAPTLVETDLRALPPAHHAFVEGMLRVATLIDALYAKQVGMPELEARVDPGDVASRALFRRNWGPSCAMTDSRACSAIAGSPPQPAGVYPAALQTEGFCARLAAREDAESLNSPFSTIVAEGETLRAIPYHEAFAEETSAVARELLAAAAALEADPAEGALVAYLRAAAQAFRDDLWGPADEAWAAMNATNSRWYVRVAPDETYWDPCSRKAGYHLTFALVDPGSIEWQARLTPLQTRMEGSLAELVGGAYAAREVSFHMPDFIRIVVNAGDDRDAFGATIGQSLPNWGAVAEQGRGRTVAMTNLYADADSLERARAVAATVLVPETMREYVPDPEAALLSTILHEATHNLGPAQEYRVADRTTPEAFGGPMASMLEELKAQSGALFYLALLEDEGVITSAQARATAFDSLLWALGHISRGMYTPAGQRRAYAQLAAIQIGFLMDRGVVRWEPEARTAEGSERGAFRFELERFREVAQELMTEVVRIMAVHDVEAATALAARYVDGELVPMPVLAERYGRSPRASFVYSLRL